ncbi:hypothetical protein Rs2_13301 [Raphanus sativus]|nr:hypothetical protein Rs2_13301 [Raphanus sativus]
MAYVDHAFSISDEDMMFETSYTVNNRPPVKEIALAVALLVFGALGIVSGFFMAYNRVGGDRGHGIFFIVLGCLLFIPGFYYTRIAYYAYKGYQENYMASPITVICVDNGGSYIKYRHEIKANGDIKYLQKE